MVDVDGVRRTRRRASLRLSQRPSPAPLSDAEPIPSLRPRLVLVCRDAHLSRSFLVPLYNVLVKVLRELNLPLLALWDTPNDEVLSARHHLGRLICGEVRLLRPKGAPSGLGGDDHAGAHWRREGRERFSLADGGARPGPQRKRRSPSYRAASISKREISDCRRFPERAILRLTHSQHPTSQYMSSWPDATAQKFCLTRKAGRSVSLPSLKLSMQV